jgi:type II secretory pathway predicted ATPase ExeA
MPAHSLGLRAQPFDDASHESAFVSNRPQQDGLRFLRTAFANGHGGAWIHGGSGVGKSTLVRHFLREAGGEAAVAYVEGEGLYASQLLAAILERFGYDITPAPTDELLNRLQAFLVQQTRSRKPPLLVVDGLNHMYPGALNVLCKLAEMRADGQFALRFVLLSDNDCGSIIGSPSMKPVADRLYGRMELRAFTQKESLIYLYEKLRAAGASRPDDIFPADVCDVLHAAAEGLPGELNRIAAAVIDQSDALPVRLERIDCPELSVVDDDSPRLILTKAGEVLQDIQLVATRVLLGRSEICDVIVDDRFVSKQHALLAWNKDSVVLIDLNSSNGTLVNSRPIKTRILRDNDVISLGDHRLKLLYANAGARTDYEDADLSDTATMANIAQLQRKRTVRQLPLKAIK